MSTDSITAPPERSEVEQRTIRKLIFRLVPFLMLLYFIAFLDRVNVGFAKLTMSADIGLSDAMYGFGAGIFFIGYFIFEVPSNLILDKVGARRWIARIMLTWGLISGAMAFVTGPTSFYILRFLLGAAEAGFFPGVIFYLSFWFPARYRAQIVALFMAAAPISVALGSPISGALLQMDGFGGLRGWQWMFLIEAAPALILSVVTFFYLTDRPAEAKWLKTDEIKWLENELAKENVGKKVTHTLGESLKVLLDPRVLLLGVIYFGTSSAMYALNLWSPSMLNDTGLSSWQTGWFNAIPSVLAVVAMYLWSRHSDKTLERKWHVFIACALAATGLVLAGFAVTLMFVLATLIMVEVGVRACKPPLWTIPSKMFVGASAATSIAAINSIGNLGGFVGPYTIGYLKTQTDSYLPGLLVVAGFLAFSAALVLLTDKFTKPANDS